ncbi:MAG: translation initiation factor IF-2 subunit beta [Candidatus Woesearchaeota archaeon]
MEYEQLLKKAKESMPEVKSSSERFEIPKVSGHLQGNKTIINNFATIAKILGRGQEKLLKYLQRELATPAVLDGQRLVLGRKITSAFINQKIEQFARDFVLCKECGKPDTQLEKEDRVLFVRCTACGARHPVRTKI